MRCFFLTGPNAGHPLASRNESIYELAEVSPLIYRTTELQLTQGSRSMLTVEVCEFEDHPDFKTSCVYHTSRGIQNVEMPRLCLANMRNTRSSVNAYISETWCTYYLASIMRESTSIVRKILGAAQQHSITNRVSSHVSVAQYQYNLADDTLEYDCSTCP